jgi:DNA primase
MRLALAHIVQSPSLAISVGAMEAFAGCDLPGFEIYRELVDFCAKSPNMTTAQLLELWRDHPAQSHLQKLATWQLPEDSDRAAQEFRDAVTGLELQWIKQRISRMEAKYAELRPEDRQKLLALQHRAQELMGELQGGDRDR